MTAECFNSLLNMKMMARHGSQDVTRDDDAASDVNSNEMFYATRFPFYTEPPGDYHSRARIQILEGEQNFHTQAGTLNGITDSFESVPMTMSWSGPSVVDVQPYAMDGSNPWSAQNPSLHEMLEPYLTRGSLEAVPSPHLSVGTLVSELSDRAHSAELRPSLSHVSFPTSSGHSDIADSSFNLTEAGFYSSSPFKTESHAYSESTYADEINSSMRRGSFHSGIASGVMRQPGQLLPASTGSSYPALTSPEEVMLTSPMDLTSGHMCDGLPMDKFSLDTLGISTNWRWDNPMDQGESRVSTPLSADGIYPTLEATKSPIEFSSSPKRRSPSRTSRRATIPQGGRVPEDSTATQRRASHGSVGVYESVPALDRSHSRGSNEDENSPRAHHLYHISSPGSDGLYHCPWENDSSCTHKPEKLKCNYDKFVDSHLKPYRCKVQACGNARFSSTACLLRHEREAHAMHGHGEKPFLCTFDSCDRGTPGNGFPRHWNLMDHMKRVHNNRSPSPSTGAKTHPRVKRRKNGSSVNKKSVGTAEFQQHQEQFLSVLQDAADCDPVAAIQFMAKSTQQLKSTVPKMERTDSQESSG